MNLRVMEKEDLPLFSEWVNKPEFIGGYNPLRQTSMAEIEKDYNKRAFEEMGFVIEKKDGTKVGYVFHFTVVHPGGNCWKWAISLFLVREAKATALKL